MRILSSIYQYREEGLLLLRVGIGLAFIFHGLPKIMGGPERWEQLGGAMGNVGLDFAPVFWGFMAAISETVGGLLLMLGFLFRPANLFMLITMIMAVIMHLNQGDPYTVYSNALKSGVVFLSFLFIGPGRYSLDAYLIGSGRHVREEEEDQREAA
jgi:putative oxidoreductase